LGKFWGNFAESKELEGPRREISREALRRENLGGKTGESVCVSRRRLWVQLLLPSPPQSLRLVAPVWNRGTSGIRGLSKAVDPEGSQKKGRTLLQFLTDHFYDVEAVREYLLRKQVLKVQKKNR
jgi:hypothetical protein